MVETAHEVLGLPADADEEQVRQRYLELVRLHPPDQDPVRFAEIRSAYDQLRDPTTRIERVLFGPTPPATVDDVELAVYRQLRQKRIPTAVLLSLAGRS